MSEAVRLLVRSPDYKSGTASANKERGFERDTNESLTADFLDRQASHANRPALFCLFRGSSPPMDDGFPSSPALRPST